MDSKWMTIPEVAAERMESQRSACRFLERARIAIYREGGRSRVLRSDFDKYMESCRIEPTPKPTLKIAMTEVWKKLAKEKKAGPGKGRTPFETSKLP
jgi:hypothetical protein